MDQIQSQRSANKIIKYIFLFGTFCLVFYLYIMYFPVPKVPAAEEDCLQKFKRNNCTLEAPITQLFKDLRYCINSDLNSNAGEKGPDKVSQIEEILLAKLIYHAKNIIENM